MHTAIITVTKTTIRYLNSYRWRRDQKLIAGIKYNCRNIHKKRKVFNSVKALTGFLKIKYSTSKAVLITVVSPSMEEAYPSLSSGYFDIPLLNTL